MHKAEWQGVALDSGDKWFKEIQDCQGIEWFDRGVLFMI